jgi:hypothetical protein
MMPNAKRLIGDRMPAGTLCVQKETNCLLLSVSGRAPLLSFVCWQGYGVVYMSASK